MTIAEPGLHRFTRAQYEQMAELGLFENQRVELLNGEILDMTPQNNPHAVAIMLLNNFLTRHLDTDQYLIRPQLPLAISEYNLPEPDMAVAAGDPRLLSDHPATALLVIEVADETIRRDRLKAANYARAGVKEYWIVNLNARKIEQHTSPVQKSDESGGHSAQYSIVRTLSETDTIECTVLTLPPRRVESFLPTY